MIRITRDHVRALPPAIVVTGLDAAAAALAPGLAVTLLSLPGAALSMGAPWWRALIAAAAHAFPATAAIDLIDCAASPGAALAALRAGLPRLVLAPEAPARAVIARAAAECGAELFPARPPALALPPDPASPRARALITAWLMTDPHPMR